MTLILGVVSAALLALALRARLDRAVPDTFDIEAEAGIPRGEIP